jgi:FKBP-type peptidyl-prolyl cis-trans isomerase
MRIARTLLISAALASSALAQDSKPAEQPAGQAATPPAPEEPAAAPDAPKPVPVPDLPIVKTTELEGGLIAEDMKIGEGYEVKAGGAVVAFYHGTLKKDGKMFDSAFERGEPIPFPLNGVIEGWQKGVPGMKVGGIRRLTIPAAMAYGERGAGEAVPPGADLVFVIQLVDALQIEDIKVGDGEAASQRCVAVTSHVITDASGKEVEKVDASKPYVWIPGEFEGLQFGLEGMKVGGKRKLIVPKEMNFPPAQAPGTRPSGVPITIELELVAIRNIPNQRR